MKWSEICFGVPPAISGVGRVRLFVPAAGRSQARESAMGLPFGSYREVSIKLVGKGENVPLGILPAGVAGKQVPRAELQRLWREGGSVSVLGQD